MDAIAQNKQSAKERKNKARIITVLVHLLLLIVLLFLGMEYQDPPPEESGIMIAFGDSESGTGEVQPETEDVQEAQPETVQETQPPVETPEEVLTQAIEDAPVISDPVEVPEPVPAEVEPEIVEPKEEVVEEEPKPVVNQKALFKPRPSATPNNTTSQGLFGNQGDQGKPDGSTATDRLGEKNYGLGKEGFAFDMAGRAVVTKPKIVDDSQATGTVVIKIKVDRSGKVISAKYTPKGSTTTNASLVSKAEKAAYQTRFSESPNGTLEQWGTITVVFKVK